MIAANASRSSTHGSVQFRPRPSHVASASVATKRGLPKFSKPRSISSSRRTLPPRLPKKWPRMPVSPKGHCSSTFQAWSSSRKIERSREMGWPAPADKPPNEPTCARREAPQFRRARRGEIHESRQGLVAATSECRRARMKSRTLFCQIREHISANGRLVRGSAPSVTYHLT